MKRPLAMIEAMSSNQRFFTSQLSLMNEGLLNSL